jgi:hypothetical protein
MAASGIVLAVLLSAMPAAQARSEVRAYSVCGLFAHVKSLNNKQVTILARRSSDGRYLQALCQTCATPVQRVGAHSVHFLELYFSVRAESRRWREIEAGGSGERVYALHGILRAPVRRRRWPPWKKDLTGCFGHLCVTPVRLDILRYQVCDVAPEVLCSEVREPIAVSCVDALEPGGS